MKNNFATLFNSLWHGWLRKRIPTAASQTLNYNKVFILPTKFGLLWLIVAITLFLFGTNYQNNLIILLSFIMLSTFITNLIFNYQNMLGLTVTSSSPPQVFAGETLGIPILLSSLSPKWQLDMYFANNNMVGYNRVTQSTVHINVPITETKRGVLKPGRLKIISRYPLGLSKTWTDIDLDIEHIVFAKPVKPDKNDQYHVQSDQTNKEQVSGLYTKGTDEFSNLQEYRPGESLKQLAWKQFAQGKGKLTKRFHQPQSDVIWISLPTTATDEIEKHLQAMSYLVESHSKSQQIFGLQLAQNKIKPCTGNAHRIQCQQIIATYCAAEERATTSEQSR